MRKPRRARARSRESMSMVDARSLVEEMIRAGAIDIAYIARIEERFPDQAGHHPEETTEVALEVLFERAPAAPPAEGIENLRIVLADHGLRATTQRGLPIGTPLPGTVRLFRAETDRRHRSGPYEGYDRTVGSRGNYFTTSPIVAAEYATPRHAPKGAPLLYVDVPVAVADAARISRADVLEVLVERDQRMPRHRNNGEVADVEYYLDDEWVGRAIRAPRTIESSGAVPGNYVFDTGRLIFGREQLISCEESVAPVHVSLQYVGGDSVAGDPGIDRSWAGETRARTRRHANAEVVVPLEHGATLFVRTGPGALSLDFLTSVMLPSSNRARHHVDISAVESTLAHIDHLVAGETAAMFQDRSIPLSDLGSIDIVVPRSETVRLAQLIARHGLAPAGAAPDVWADAASVLRKLLVATEALPLRSDALGNVTITVLPDTEFSRLGRDTVATTLSSIDLDGKAQSVPLQMTRSSNSTRRAARRTRGRRRSRES